MPAIAIARDVRRAMGELTGPVDRPLPREPAIKTAGADAAGAAPARLYARFRRSTARSRYGPSVVANTAVRW
jgi:hypothetical protein